MEDQVTIGNRTRQPLLQTLPHINTLVLMSSCTWLKYK